MYRFRLIGLPVVVVTSVFFIPPENLQAAQGTECTFTVPIVITPGISETPSSGSFYTPGGESGDGRCNGPVGGEDPTGSGTFSADGRYGTGGPVTCSSGGKGWGVHSMTFPTSSGTVNVKSAWTMDFGGLKNGILRGTFEGDYFSGTFEVRPTKGDCFTSPVTEEITVLKGILHEYRAR
jgi:hypothetical protein